MAQYAESTCEILCEDNGEKAVGEILQFFDKQKILVSINRVVKLELRWNGQVYEGRSSGLTFTTDGPLGYSVQRGRGRKK